MPTMPNVVGQLISGAERSLENPGVLNTAQIGYFGTWPITVIAVRASSVPQDFTADSIDLTADSGTTIDTSRLAVGPGVIVAQLPISGSPVAANAPVLLVMVQFPTGFSYPAQNWSAF